MAYLILILLLLLPLRARAACDPAITSSVLPRAGLKMLNHKQCDWDVPIQETDTILDTRAGFLDVASPWTAKQTFKANPVRLGGILFDFAITTSDEWAFRLDPYDATITRIECQAYTGTSFTINICKGVDLGDDSCTTQHAALTCTSAGASTTTISSPNVSARDKVSVLVTAVSGAVTKGEVYIEGVAR